jgi:hypothetical protein
MSDFADPFFALALLAGTTMAVYGLLLWIEGSQGLMRDGRTAQAGRVLAFAGAMILAIGAGGLLL